MFCPLSAVRNTSAAEALATLRFPPLTSNLYPASVVVPIRTLPISVTTNEAEAFAFSILKDVVEEVAPDPLTNKLLEAEPVTIRLLENLPVPDTVILSVNVCAPWVMLLPGVVTDFNIPDLIRELPVLLKATLSNIPLPYANPDQLLKEGAPASFQVIPS